jgi:hypothetical protein
MGRSFVTVSVDTEKDMAEYGKEERTILPGSYGCDILLQDTTLDKVKDPSFPNDAYLIWYNNEGTERLDLVRGSRVRIFDMYYDKYGPGVIKRLTLDMEELTLNCGDINNQRRKRKDERRF